MRRAGRPPAATAAGPASGKAPRANTTDPDSRAMRGRHTLLQGYNAQAVVTTGQVVVGADLVQNAVDRTLLHPVLDVTRAQLHAAGIAPALDTVLADAGYASEDAYARARDAGLHLLAPVVSDERRAAGEDPGGGRDLRRLPATAAAQAKLRTRQGQEHYAQRGRTVEPVFGQIKEQQRFRQFSRRGLPACRAEWLLVCAAHNLRKLHRSGDALPAPG